MAYGRVHYFPIILCLWFFLTILLMYAISVALKDVEPVFPYISDTGTFVPESCIFGQLLNTGSIIMGIVIYLRYINVKELQRITESENVEFLNTVCLYLGWIAAFGVSVVANFQETNILIVHLIGAIMAFGLGFVYQFMMWRAGAILNEHSRKLNNFRLFLSIVSMIGFVFCFAFALPAYLQFKGQQMTKWKEEDGGYTLHLISTFSEWICATSTMLFILSYYVDFKKIRVQPPKVELLVGNKY